VVEANTAPTFEPDSEVARAVIDVLWKDPETGEYEWTMSIGPEFDFKGAETLYFRVTGKDANGEEFVVSAKTSLKPDDDISLEWGDLTVTGFAETAGFLTVEEENNITLLSTYEMPLSQAADNSFTLTVQEDGADVEAGTSRSIKWYIDGVHLAPSGGDSGDDGDDQTTLTINADDYSVGVHYATVLVYKDGVPYSPPKEIRFRVTD
jgi:hypothetical protein